MLALLALLAAPMAPATVASTAEPTPIPPPVKAMLDAAIASGNDAEIAIVARYARTAAPQSADAITALVDSWHHEQTAKHEAAIRDAGPLDLWRGKAELGGYFTTGNTRDVG